MVVSLANYRKKKECSETEVMYTAKIRQMDKLELLEEMVHYQESRALAGKLTLYLIVTGKILFKALEESAETTELRLLTRSYRKHLDYELAEYLKHEKV